MLRHPDDSATADGQDIAQLLERLASDSRQWAEAEVTLARIELAELKTQARRAAVLVALAGGAALCMLVALTEAAIAVAATRLSAPGLAALAVAAVLALLALACGLAARRAIAWRTESLLFRWLGSR